MPILTPALGASLGALSLPGEPQPDSLPDDNRGVEVVDGGAVVLGVLCPLVVLVLLEPDPRRSPESPLFPLFATDDLGAMLEPFLIPKSINPKSYGTAMRTERSADLSIRYSEGSSAGVVTDWAPNLSQGEHNSSTTPSDPNMRGHNRSRWLPHLSADCMLRSFC
jgi:hypothetical protein